MNKGVGSHTREAIHYINKVRLTWLGTGEGEVRLTTSSITGDDFMGLLKDVHVCTGM
jgi:hypothetical protein